LLLKEQLFYINVYILGAGSGMGIAKHYGLDGSEIESWCG